MLSDPQRLEALRRTELLDAGPSESFDRLSALAAQLVNAPVALVSLVDHDRQYFVSCIGLQGPEADHRQTPLTHSICQYALSSDGPLVIPDTLTDPRLADNLAPGELNVRAYLGIPLVDGGGHILGSFCVIDHIPRQWGAGAVEIMAALAGSVMAEIQLREALVDRERLARDAALAAARTQQVLDRLPLLVALLDPSGTILEVNQQVLETASIVSGQIVGRSLWQIPGWRVNAADRQELTAAFQRAATGTPSRFDAQLRVVDGDGGPLTVDLSLAPMRDETGAVNGVVASAFDISDRRELEQELSRLAANEQRQRQRAERLGRLAASLAAAATVDEVAAAITDLAKEAVGASYANLAVITPEQDLELRHGVELDLEVVARWPRVPLDSSSPLGHAVSTNRRVVLSNPEEIRSRFPSGADDAERAGLQAVVAIPVIRGQAAVGFAWPEPLVDSDSRSSDVMVVAELCGRALMRARSHEQEREIALRLQQSLLPPNLPKPPGVDLATRYEAGARGMEVGGDWYDLVTPTPNRLIAIVGDVVGRGLAAATAMGQLRHTCSALASAVDDIEEMVAQLDLLAPDIEGAHMATMVVASLDLLTYQLDIVSAGHPPAVVRRASGRVQLAVGGNLPLGIRRDSIRPRQTLMLERGDALLLYTDGLIERRGVHLDESLRMLMEAVSVVDDSSARAMADAIFDCFAEDRDDDVAVLALRVL